MNLKSSRVSAVAVGILLSFVAAARDFPVGNAGSMSIDLPAGWEASTSGATIGIQAKDPRRLRMMITPFPMKEANVDVRPAVERAADRVAPHSVEKMVVLQRFEGRDTRGYYFKATDPSPKPDEYRFMYQGGLSSGMMTAPFTILFNDGAEKDAADALAALRTVRFKPSAQ